MNPSNAEQWTSRDWAEFYKGLLLKYMRMIGRIENTTYWEDRPDYFTEYEWKTLKYFNKQGITVVEKPHFVPFNPLGGVHPIVPSDVYVRRVKSREDSK
jgi:hypothetical protein